MASVLDIGGLAFFSRLWPFLLVLVATYAVLGFVNVFKESKPIRAMIAFLLAVMASMYPIAYKTLNLAAPWFVLMIFLGIFLLIAYQLFGVSHEHIVKVITGQTSGDYGRTFGFWMLALVLIITIGSLSSVISQEKKFTSLTEEGTAPQASVEPVPAGEQPLSEQVGFFTTLTHPKVLGMILLLLVAFFTIGNLAEK